MRFEVEPDHGSKLVVKKKGLGWMRPIPKYAGADQSLRKKAHLNLNTLQDLETRSWRLLVTAFSSSTT